MNELQEQKRQLLKEQQKKAESSKKKATTKQASPSKLPFVGGFTPKKSTTAIVLIHAIETTFTPIRRQRVRESAECLHVEGIGHCPRISLFVISKRQGF